MYVDTASLLMSIIATTPSNTLFHQPRKMKALKISEIKRGKRQQETTYGCSVSNPPLSVMSKKTYVVMVLPVYACMCHEYDAVTPDALMVGS